MVSHISQKTSEMWGTRPSSENQRPQGLKPSSTLVPLRHPEKHMSAEERLLELGITLPGPPAPGGNYVPAIAVGSLLYLAGAISTQADGVITGTAGADRSIADGYAAARACVLTQLAVLKNALGSLDKVQQIVSVNGYVNAVAGFPDSPAVINGASDLLVAIFGDAGRHVRAAVGVNALPRNALVELQMIVAV